MAAGTKAPVPPVVRDGRIDVLATLEAAIARSVSAAAWASGRGLSSVYVCDVRRGVRPPGPAILAALGLEKVVSYASVAPAAPVDEARS